LSCFQSKYKQFSRFGEEEAAENKNNMTIFEVGERKGGDRKQK
jgi:hypothetical protein